MGARTGKGSEDIDEYSILTSRAIVGTYMLVAVKKKHIDFVEKIEFEDIRLQRYLGGAVLGEQSLSINTLLHISAKFFDR